MPSDKLKGHLSIAAAYTIFGLNLVFSKDIANSGTVSPYVLFTLRAIGASALFWLLSLFMPKEKVDRGDYWKIAAASLVGLFRPLISKYSVVTFMKWTFLFSLIVSLPISAKGLITTDYTAIPVNVRWEIGYLIFFATSVAYFLIPYGQKFIRPTLVSMYSYVQPIIAAIVSIWTGYALLAENTRLGPCRRRSYPCEQE